MELKIILIIGALIIGLPILSVWYRSMKESGVVQLKAIESHSNRSLSFTKGKLYGFHMSGNVLICNADDSSGDRDNFVFTKIDLKGFEPTDLYSRFVLRKIL